MIPAHKKYFVYPWCVDGRKSFNGLAGIVRTELGNDPANGDVFVFLSKTRQSIKLLFWEHGGFVIYYKKMDRGNFEAPPLRADGKGSYISEIQLLQVLRGVEFHPEKLAKKRQREVLTLEQ
ncbi:IS66 family insertion sequence element accessory protein TnpB [Sphingobacterium sp. JB170]|uniref:IS66 family insertion sequence element accessory protein TnpB n=1 Tax=Sphingobacterium sp. JB170 TaxID=1434842 RepID=UPI000B34DC90|nr:IS66 family insertion sequence element accessory protein TnpB [Sphingobacterium sp. JB170]